MSRSVLIIATVVLITGITGCLSPQTVNTSSVVDSRPIIMFDPASAPPLEVFIDGLSMGTTDQYRKGKAGLRILPGTHVLVLKGRGQIVRKETFYIGTGSSKTFVINNE